MKLPSCPNHGGRDLINAGAPYMVRCCAGGSCGRILERCRSCHGHGCAFCGGAGWQERRSYFGGIYPVG